LKSQLESLNKQILDQVTSELEMSMIWLEDTLTSSVDLMKLKAMIYDMDADIKIFQSRNGVTESNKKSANRVNEMIILADKLDKIATQNNVYKLVLKQYENRISWLIHDKNELEKELKAVKKAWES
jgi:dsDNA-binding SOS-regulon protein